MFKLTVFIRSREHYIRGENWIQLHVACDSFFFLLSLAPFRHFHSYFFVCEWLGYVLMASKRISIFIIKTRKKRSWMINTIRVNWPATLRWYRLLNFLVQSSTLWSRYQLRYSFYSLSRIYLFSLKNGRHIWSNWSEQWFTTGKQNNVRKNRRFIRIFVILLKYDYKSERNSRSFRHVIRHLIQKLIRPKIINEIGNFALFTHFCVLFHIYRAKKKTTNTLHWNKFFLKSQA